MVYRLILATFLMLMSVAAFGQDTATPTDTPTNTATNTPTDTPTATPTDTPTPILHSSQRFNRGGVAIPTPQALSTTFGNKCKLNGDNTFFMICNAGEDARAVTYIQQRAPRGEDSAANKVVTVSAGTTIMVGPFHSREWFNRNDYCIHYWTSGAGVSIIPMENPSHWRWQFTDD